MNSNSSVIKVKQKQRNKQAIYIHEYWVSRLNCKIEFLCHITDIKIAWINPCSSTDYRNYRKLQNYKIYKNIEKVVHNQTMNYVMEKNILYRYQSGFGKNHSTDTSLSYLTDVILSGFDSGLLTRMILIDLQKAFDIINHGILLKNVCS